MIDLRGALARALRQLDVRTRTREALVGQRPRRVLGVGKAASAMIDGAFEACGATIEAALVVLPDGSPAPRDDARIRVVRASHPLPDARSVAAGEAALTFAPDLALISGGTSSLIFVPLDTLENARGAIAALLASGATVQEINAVRRHASRAHGGRLGAVTTLLVSDVLGGAPNDIGSGPTAPDPSTVSDALGILGRYAPTYATLHLEESRKGASRAQTVVILAEPEALAHAMASELAALGVRATVAESTNDDVVALARRYVALAGALGAGEAIVCAAEPRLQIDVAEPGAGGRCTHLAALVARDLPAGVTFAAVASDGVDGVSGTSGAIVTSDSFPDRAALDAALAAFDTGTLHQTCGTALPPGPTGANFADLHVLVGIPGATVRALGSDGPLKHLGSDP